MGQNLELRNRCRMGCGTPEIEHFVKSWNMNARGACPFHDLYRFTKFPWLLFHIWGFIRGTHELWDLKLGCVFPDFQRPLSRNYASDAKTFWK